MPKRRVKPFTKKSLCAVCYVRKFADPSVPCHPVCRNCLKKWYDVDSSKRGQCPTCRGFLLQHSDRKEEREVRSPTATACPLTQQWLESHTKSCPECNIPIEKVDGCASVKCRCGIRFCYSCGQRKCICAYAVEILFGFRLCILFWAILIIRIFLRDMEDWKILLQEIEDWKVFFWHIALRACTVDRDIDKGFQ